MTVANVPSRNINSSANFSFFILFTRSSVGTGRHRMKTSVRMLKPEVK